MQKYVHFRQPWEIIIIIIIYILRHSCKQGERAYASPKTLKKNIKNDSLGTFYSNERHPASVRLSADVQTYSVAKQADRKQPS